MGKIHSYAKVRVVLSEDFKPVEILDGVHKFIRSAFLVFNGNINLLRVGNGRGAQFAVGGCNVVDSIGGVQIELQPLRKGVGDNAVELCIVLGKLGHGRFYVGDAVAYKFVRPAFAVSTIGTIVCTSDFHGCTHLAFSVTRIVYLSLQRKLREWQDTPSCLAVLPPILSGCRKRRLTESSALCFSFSAGFVIL